MTPETTYLKNTSTASILIIFLLFASNTIAQRLKNETIEYNYLQLPLEPLDVSIKNYQSTLTQEFLNDNIEKQAAYEAEMAAAKEEFERKEAEYPALLAAAEKKYEDEMKAWDEKSIADKVIEKKVLNEDNKPVMQTPPVPYLQSVQLPKMQREYDSEALAATYLTLDGFNNASDNAVSIEVIMYGFESTNPQVITEVKNVVKDGNTTKVNYYHVEYTYRHTMSVTVTNPDGTERFKLAPSELNNYTKYKTNSSKTRPSINHEALILMHEEAIVQNNLEFIRNLINDKMGFKKQPRTIELYYVNDKKGEYNDLTEGYNVMTSGLNALFEGPEAAKGQLEQAISLFESALDEADMNNKKARINAKVALPMHFNLLECYFATSNMEKATSLLSSLNSLSLNKKEREQKQELESLITDTKNRIEANN